MRWNRSCEDEPRPLAERGHGHVQRLHERRLRRLVHALLPRRRQHLHALFHRRAQHRGELRGEAGVLQQRLGAPQVREVVLGERAHDRANSRSGSDRMRSKSLAPQSEVLRLQALDGLLAAHEVGPLLERAVLHERRLDVAAQLAHVDGLVEEAEDLRLVDELDHQLGVRGLGDEDRQDLGVPGLEQLEERDEPFLAHGEVGHDERDLLGLQGLQRVVGASPRGGWAPRRPAPT